MNTDSTALYKLMVVYMLSKVNFPLSNTQLSSFMLDKQYTDYFTFQETINSLVEDGFIRGYSHQSSTHYTLTKEGEETIAFFYTKISTAIRDDIETYLFDNKYELKNEAGTVTDCYKLSNGNYIAHCQLKEGDTTLIELNLNVPVEEQAEIICARWRENSQEVYESISCHNSLSPCLVCDEKGIRISSCLNPSPVLTAFTCLLIWLLLILSSFVATITGL